MKVIYPSPLQKLKRPCVSRVILFPSAPGTGKLHCMCRNIMYLYEVCFNNIQKTPLRVPCFPPSKSKHIPRKQQYTT